MTGTVIYHGGCTDGVAAAWAAWRKHPHYRFIPGVYQEEPDWHLVRVSNPLYLVDFSYKRPVLERMIAEAPGKVYVLDHHKTAERDLLPLMESGELHGEFDMNRCGAMITHQWFHRYEDGSPEPLPPLLTYVDARDRWVKPAPPGTDEIIMAVRSYPHDVESAGGTWEALMKIWSHLMDTPTVIDLEHEGVAINRYYRQRVEQAKSNAREWQFIEPDDTPLIMPAVNDNYSVASDVAGELAEDASDGMACVFWTDGYEVTFSVRSRGEIDAGAWCEGFAGGGGHPGAAGFKVDSRHVHLDARTVFSPKLDPDA